MSEAGRICPPPAEAEGPRMAVLMACYNRAETTLRGLESLFSAQPSDVALDVFLVDDASPDGTAARVRAAYPQVHVIDGPGNLFWCRGMRRAWDEALVARPSYDYYLWFNDDAILKPGAIAGLLADCAAQGGLVVGKFSSDATERDVSYGFDGNGAWMNGNLVLVPRRVFEAVGPIYDGYRHAYGDHDYGLAARRKGFPVRLSSAYCGVCPRQPERYLSMEGRPLRERMRILFDTKGVCLHDAVLFRRRNWGLLMAGACVVHLVLKALFGGRSGCLKEIKVL